MTFKPDNLPDVIDGAAVIGVTYEMMFMVSDPIEDEDVQFVVGAEAMQHARDLVAMHRAAGRKVMLVVSLRAQAAMDGRG